MARVLVIAAHPDDETLGAGALLGHLEDVFVLHVTDGAPRDPALVAEGFTGSRDDYACARRAELDAAMALAAVPPDRLLRVGACDQEAIHEAPRIARELALRIGELAPDVVITHPYEGGHPDHDATALATQAAIALLEQPRTRSAPGLEQPRTRSALGLEQPRTRSAPGLAQPRTRSAPGGDRGGLRGPMRVEMTSYHAAEGELVAGTFLPGGGAGVAIPLGAPDRERKARMLARFTTQRGVLALFPPCAVERFRPAPVYDFSRPPHAGALYYERHGWPLTGERWRELALAALAALSPDAELSRERGLCPRAPGLKRRRTSGLE